MAPASRCKMRIDTVKLTSYGDEVTLSAQFDGPLSKEERAFSDATPSADFVLQIANPKLRGQYKPGQEFYVDLVPIAPANDQGSGGG